VSLGAAVAKAAKVAAKKIESLEKIIGGIGLRGFSCRSTDWLFFGKEICWKRPDLYIIF